MCGGFVFICKIASISLLENYIWLGAFYLTFCKTNTYKESDYRITALCPVKRIAHAPCYSNYSKKSIRSIGGET
jgi:hypothetical protein